MIFYRTLINNTETQTPERGLNRCALVVDYIYDPDQMTVSKCRGVKYAGDTLGIWPLEFGHQISTLEARPLELGPQSLALKAWPLELDPWISALGLSLGCAAL